MFEMDAFVGVDVLGLSFMKGDQPHAGFPEAAYHGMAEQLARSGYRVVVVEQVRVCEGVCGWEGQWEVGGQA
jgi:DNA mismatch repair protein MSH6